MSVRRPPANSADRLVQRLIILALATVVLSVICSLIAVNLFRPAQVPTNLPQSASEKPLVAAFKVEAQMANTAPIREKNGRCDLYITGFDPEGRPFLVTLSPPDCNLIRLN